MVLQISVQFVTRILLTLTLLRLVSADSFSEDFNYRIVNKVIRQCSISNVNKYSCMANKAAIAMERAINFDVPIFDGISLVRNEEYIDNGTVSRSYTDGINRLSMAVGRFLDSHVIKLDLTEESEARGEEGGLGLGAAAGGDTGGGGGVVGSLGKKEGKKEKKYLHYALMVLLGVFGISGPLIMKTLALIAGKALIASKIALIMVGSIALKKIFEKDHAHSTVKVHTHTIKDYGDDYDRNIDAGAYKFLKTI